MSLTALCHQDSLKTTREDLKSHPTAPHSMMPEITPVCPSTTTTQSAFIFALVLMTAFTLAGKPVV